MKALTLASATLAVLFLADCGEGSPDSKPMLIPSYHDDWKLIEVKPRDSAEVWMIRKNVGIAKIQGFEGLPTLVYLTVHYQPKDASGLPNAEDAGILYDFEETAIPEIETLAGCRLVASVMKSGVKDHLFYVSDSSLFHRALDAHRKSLMNLKASLEKHEDPRWDVYEDFPDGT